MSNFYFVPNVQKPIKDFISLSYLAFCSTRGVSWGGEVFSPPPDAINPIPGEYFMYVGRGGCKITINRQIKETN